MCYRPFTQMMKMQPPENIEIGFLQHFVAESNTTHVAIDFTFVCVCMYTQFKILIIIMTSRKPFRFQCGFSKVTKWTIKTVLLSIIQSNKRVRSVLNSNSSRLFASCANCTKIMIPAQFFVCGGVEAKFIHVSTNYNVIDK